MTKFSRRRFAQMGAAAGLLGLPLFDSLNARSARADGSFPRRLVLMFDPNGTIQDQFWPTAGGTETDFTFNAITKPLETFKDRLLFLKGLSISVHDKGPGGPHQKGVGGLFTNSVLQEGTFVDGDGAMSGWADGISVDQEVARNVGQQNFLPSLELGVRAVEADVRGRISYAGPGNPMPPINAPLEAYERLFSSFTDVDEGRKADRKSVVDALKGEYSALEPKLSRVDQQKLAQHLELVRGIERRLNIAVDTGLCTRPPAPADMADDSEDTMVSVAQLHGELIASAFACDLTRVASIQYCNARNEFRFPWLPSMGAGHALSHSSDTDVDAVAERVLRGAWFATQLADLMRKLDAIPEGDGTVLDNTLILWGNELGRGNSHSHDDIPFLVAGGTGGQFRMGRFLDFGGKSHAGLLVAVLNAMGVAATSFGDPDYADGPLDLS
jgi:Protein of unknown function (DUF1552)